MDIEHYARQIVNRLTIEGYVAYYAGGWVRDFVMQHPSSDIDIATNATPEVILDLFPRTILVGLAFGVVIVVIEGHQFEVSTFRKDINYEGGRRPTSIEFCDAEDAIRRDFTINGMFYDPIEERLIDYVGGAEDIKKEVIRTIGEAQERFSEDRLRMIRAVRFASRFGFKIDSETQQGIIENADTLFPAVAMERVWQEFNKMASFQKFDQALIELHRFGLLQVIFPQLQSVHLRDIKQETAHFVHFSKNTPTILFLMELFPHAPLDEQLEIGRALRISNQDIKLIECIYKMRKMIENERKGEEADLFDWAHLYTHPQSPICLEVIASRLDEGARKALLEIHAKRRESLRPHMDRIQNKKTIVAADTLKSIGFSQGKELGDLLKEAEKIAIRKNLQEEEEVLRVLKSGSLWEKLASRRAKGEP